MSMHYDSESLVDRGRSPRLFAKITRFLNIKILIYFNHTKITRLLYVKNLIIQKSYIFNTSKKVVRLFLFEKMQ